MAESGPDMGTPGEGGNESKKDWLWPLIIIATLVTVVAVNAAFIYIASSGQDVVDPAYLEGER